MGFQLKLLSVVVFLLLSLSSCQAKNVTVNVIGLVQCTDCIKHGFNNSRASTGINVAIICKSRNQETKPQGNGAIDKEGKFNVKVSTEITEDGDYIEACFAKLQNASTAPCPINTTQTASLKLLTSHENNATQTYNTPTIIKFSPLTCQSAFFFWPRPNFTFFHPSPPPPALEYPAPPSEALPPSDDLIPLPPPPSQPPAPMFQGPISTPSPTFQSPSPSPSPISQDPIFPPSPNQASPNPPPIDPPISSPSPNSKTPNCAPSPKQAIPNSPTQIPQPISSPSPKQALPNSPQNPKNEKPFTFPRAPPVPRLPPIPTVPRKYFNSPKSKSKPPHSY